MSKRKRSRETSINNNINTMSPLNGKFESVTMTNNGSLFSSSWMAMGKPTITRAAEDFKSQEGSDVVGYNNLFADYTIENPAEEEKVEISAAEDCRRSYVNLVELAMDKETNYLKSSSNDLLQREISEKTRHDRNGAFTFKHNGEYDMMLHVQRGLGKLKMASMSDIQASNAILAAVDEYCTNEQWMYHIGREKGESLKHFVSECIDMHKNSQRKHRPLAILDVGTYCAYSAILLAKSVKELAPGMAFHVFTTEINTQNIMVASSMILMAKLQKYITVIPFQPSVESLSGLLRKKAVSQVDFLFLDHAKDMYLEDLKELEHNRFIKRGSHVAADNVIFNRLDGYRKHVRDLANKFITETRLAEMTLEYSDDIKDGIELTKYLMDPPNK